MYCRMAMNGGVGDGTVRNPGGQMMYQAGATNPHSHVSSSAAYNNVLVMQQQSMNQSNDFSNSG